MLDQAASTLMEQFMLRDFYVIGFQAPGMDSSVIYGPYLSEVQANKAMKSLVSPGPGQSKAAVWKARDIPNLLA